MSNSILEKNEPFSMTASDLARLMTCKCEHPKKFTNINGREVIVECGTCPSCMRRKRQEKIFQFTQETNSPYTLCAIGFTWTYGFLQKYNPKTNSYEDTDQRTVPYLPKKDLDYLLKQRLERTEFSPTSQYSNCLVPDGEIKVDSSYGFTIESIRTFKNPYGIYKDCDKYYEPIRLDKNGIPKGFRLKFLRGASPKSLTSKENIALLNYDDATSTIKKVRARFSEYLKKKGLVGEAGKDLVTLRYAIHCEYGTYYTVNRGTAAPHYHGIVWLSCEDLSYKETLLPHVSDLKKYVEERLMDSWIYSKRVWDDKKKLYIGKDIHTVEPGFAAYLCSYLNKTDFRDENDALGPLFIPERLLTSRSNPKNGQGFLGYSWYLDNKEWLLSSLDKANKEKSLWSPMFKPDGQDKPIPVPALYKKQALMDYFGIDTYDPFTRKEIKRSLRPSDLTKYSTSISDKLSIAYPALDSNSKTGFVDTFLVDGKEVENYYRYLPFLRHTSNLTNYQWINPGLLDFEGYKVFEPMSKKSSVYKACTKYREFLSTQSELRYEKDLEFAKRFLETDVHNCAKSAMAIIDNFGVKTIDYSHSLFNATPIISKAHNFAVVLNKVQKAREEALKLNQELREDSIEKTLGHRKKYVK